MLKAALLARMNEKANRYQFSIPLYQKLACFPVDIDFILPDTPLSMNYDCLIIPGGDDIHPRYFHQSLHSATHLVPEAIDTMDFRWAKAYLKLHKPIFGICRGFQVLAALDHGKLNQHNPQHINTSHSLIINDGFLKLCHSIYPKNSFHHQSLHQLNQFHVSAFSLDGVIEAFENETTWAVQWHPELDERDEILSLFFKHQLHCEVNQNDYTQ